MADRAHERRTNAFPRLAGAPARSAALRFVLAPLAAALLLLPGLPDAEGRPAGRRPVPAGGAEDGRGAAGQAPQHRGPRRPSLVEAADRNRERIAGSRRRGGSAPRYDDAALTAARRSAGADAGPAESSAPRSAAGPVGQRPGEESPEDAAPPEVADGPGLPEPRGETSAAERAAARRERERLLRERLLDLEWALAAVGASGLPYAPRNPNRAFSPLDAGRFRARQEEIRRELAASAEEAAAGRRPRPQ